MIPLETFSIIAVTFFCLGWSTERIRRIAAQKDRDHWMSIARRLMVHIDELIEIVEEKDLPASRRIHAMLRNPHPGKPS